MALGFDLAQKRDCVKYPPRSCSLPAVLPRSRHLFHSLPASHLRFSCDQVIHHGDSNGNGNSWADRGQREEVEGTVDYAGAGPGVPRRGRDWAIW